MDAAARPAPAPREPSGPAPAPRAQTSVRSKLLSIVSITTGAALLIAAGALLAYDVQMHRTTFIESLRTQGEILALSAEPALAFDDRASASRALSSLRAGPAVQAAALYMDGEKYVDYSRNGEATPPDRVPPLPTGTRIDGERVELLLPVRQNGELLGYVYLRARDEIAVRVRTYLSILAVVLAASMLAALVLSRRLHASITAPLEAMAGVARDVVEKRDFSLRATKRTDDEIGLVVDAFNAMLDEIEVRAAALRDSEQVYRAIGESIDHGVWIADAAGRCVYVSDSFLHLVDMTQEQCGNEGWFALLHPDDREKTLDAWHECVRTGSTWYCEHRILGVDGHYHPILAQGVPIRDGAGRITRWAGINLDISRLKATEEALRIADRRKDEFLATLAHELRNPLAPIRHAAKLLGSPQAEARHLHWARDVIARQVARMALLLDDLLDVSRITRGLLRLKKERVDLATVISTAVETAHPLIDAKRHVLQVRTPTRAIALEADALRLSQAISNLLTNAAKYTDPGGRITLEAEVGDEGLEISVSDDGIGLAPEALPALFQMFTQVDGGTERAEGGLGIGLALVRGLVELHGGRVDVASEGVGKGSRFTIRLPKSLLREPRDRSVVVAAPKPGTARPLAGRILVADDNRDAADALAAVLQLQGYAVEVAYGGRDALALAERWLPDVMILDVGMPDLTGHEIAREVRQRPWGQHAMLLAVTGWGQETDRSRSREAGFDHHLTKPVDPDEVERLLGSVQFVKAQVH